MAVSNQPQTGLASTATLRGDLSWVACQAATEIDNLLLGKSIKLEAVKGLSSALSDSFLTATGSASQALLIDPTTTVVLTHALRDSDPSREVGNMDDLKKLTKQFVIQLEQMNVRSAETSNAESSLQFLRAFCLAVSRHAATTSPSSYHRPEHPFRR
jgi:hypothetical protein